MKTKENLYRSPNTGSNTKSIIKNEHSFFQRKKSFNNLSKVFFWVFSIVIIGIILAVLGYLIAIAVPFIRTNTFGGFFSDFLFGSIWNPAAGQFGIFTFIVSSVATTVIALLLSFPLGMSISLLLVFYLPRFLKGLLRASIDLLAGIPSVIYGFFGAIFFGGFLNFISGGQIATLSVFTASLILTFMTLPTMVVFINLAMEAVPNNIVLGSIALGATQMETSFKISIHSSKAGILGAVIAAFGRAIGEAAAVTLIIGGSVASIDSAFEGFLFRSGSSLTSILTSFIQEANGNLRAVLFTVGIIILVIATAVNIVALFIQQKLRKKWK